MNNTFGLGPLDRLEQELGLGQPLQNANRGIAADQGSEYQLPDVDIGQQPRQQGQQSSATYQQQQVDTRQPQQPMMNGSSGLLPPQPLVSAFESASTKHDVPVNVLMALAQQESSYNANAKGPQTQWGNAMGMMQYLGSTAKMMGINPYDPIQSIDAAAKQIRQRLDKGYSMEDAVKEHFAGPNRNLWGAKTKQYGIDVMGKAARIADEMYGHLRPENLQAQEALDTAFAEQESRLSEPVNLSNSVYENILQIGLPSGDELVDGDRLHLVGRTRFERDIANGWQNLAKIAPNDDLGKRLQEQSNYLQEEAKKNLSRTEQLTLRNDMALFERELSAYNQTVDNYNNGLERLQELDKQFDETYNQQEIRPREVTWYEKIGNWLPQGSPASNAFKNIPKGWRNAKAEATISDVLAEGREGETDDTMPYLERLKGGAAEGFNNMVDALGTTKFILAGGDSDQMAEALSTKMTEQAEREKRRSAGDLQIRSTFGAVSDAEGGSEIIGSSIYALGSILRNAEDFGITIAEQAGNMIPTMAGGLGGAATGAAGGAAVGGLPGASAGAIYGGSAGMMAGTTAIEVGFETEEMIMNRLSENGLPPTKENIKAILDDPEFISEAREQGLKKGITLAAVDQLFMAIGGAVASRPFRQAGQQALTEIPKPKFRTKVKAGFQGFGIDVVGEGAAEAASQQVARGEIDAGDVLLETAAGFGSSMITTPVAAGAAILNDRVRNRGQAGVPPVPIDPNTRQPIDEVVEEETQTPSGPTSRAAQAGMVAAEQVLAEEQAGMVAAEQALAEEQAIADSRVVVSSPTANISGFLDDYQEDGEGGFTARVLGDDGTTYQFTQNDPINIVPEAQFLAEQEALAEQVASGNIDPETGEVLTTDETSSESLLVDEEAPITESVQAEPTTEESQESVAPVDESESLTDEQQLVRSLEYYTEQARINGGWSELLTSARDNAQEALSVIPPSEVIPLATDVTTPNGNPLFEVFYPAIGQNVLVREDQWNNRNNLSDGLPYFDHQGRRGRLHSIRPEEIAGLRNSTNQTAKPIEAPQGQAPETAGAVAEATKPVSTMDVEDVEFVESQTPSMDFEQEALAASEPTGEQPVTPPIEAQEQAPVEEKENKGQSVADAAVVAGRILGANKALQNEDAAREVAYEAKRDLYSKNFNDLSKIEEAEEMLMGTDSEMPFPSISVDDKPRFGTSGGYNHYDNTIHISNNPSEWSASNSPESVIPERTIYHEVGHWGFMNGLTGRDRVSIAQEIKGDLRKELIPGKEGQDYPRSKFDDLDEYVAEMYSNHKRGLPTDNRLMRHFNRIDDAIADHQDDINKAIQDAEKVRAKRKEHEQEVLDSIEQGAEVSEPSSIEQQAEAQAERTKDRTERIKSATSLDEWRDIINEQGADPSPTGSNPNEFVQASKRAYDRLNGQLEKRRNRAIEEIEQEGNIKWFGSEETAQEYLDRNGLNDLYDANLKPVYGVRRYVIERKGVDYPSEYSEEQLEKDISAAQTWDNAEGDLKQEIIRRGKVGKTNQDLTFNQLPRKVQERVIGAIARIESEQPTEVVAESVELPTEVAELPTEVTELATEVVEEVSTPSPDSDLFANNTLFTSDAVEKARARLRSKLRNANSGIDPEVLVDGMTIAGAYIEAGVRNFTDYANRMVSDLGDDIKPYLLSFWEGARNYPNLNTENMTSVDDSYKLHQEILNPQDLNNPAIGEINEVSDNSAPTSTSRASGPQRAAKKAAPKRAKTQKALRRDGRLKQDYGVTHIDGYSDDNSGRETGSATKDAFLKDAKRYLDGVKDQLEELGYTPYTNAKGKNITPVYINEGGDAVSGEVTLNMQGPNGVGAYIVVGGFPLRGTVPTTASGVSIMMRTNDASDIYRGHANKWVSTDLTGAELAKLADGYVKLKEAANEQSNERVQAPNRVGVSAVDTGRADNAQQAPTQGDIGNVEVTESENVPQVTEPTDGEEVSLRPATEDVAEEGRASASRLSDDGRTRASGSGISDARARESERADVTRQRDSDSVKDPKTVSPSNQGAGDLFIADPMAIVGGGQEARFNKNQEAIELRNTLIDEARKPTKEEQEVLAGYTGWGSFGQELFQGSWNNPQPKKGWESRDKWLRDNLGQAEWEGMQRSIINAHYTDPPTVMAMWDMMKRMGFDGGRVLEPSIGIGNFFGMMPRELSSRSQRTGIELDPVTGSMAQMIYPESNIQIMGYEKSNTPDNFYDVVIGNWPFANISPADRRYNRFSPMLHDYFFLKALDQTRPGGIVMGITSKGTMDKVDSRVRYELAKKGELVAAFRLPSGAFQGYAGTSVVTDIIILRKRTEPESIVANDGWIKSMPYKTPSGPEVNLNEYYVANPSHVLGTIDAGRGMYRQDEMIVNRPDNLMERLRKAVDSVPEGAYHTDTRGESISYIANHTDDRTNALIQQDGQFYVVQGEHLLNANDDVLKYKVKSDKTTADREAQFSKLINMRKLYGELIELERGNNDAEPKRKELKDAYEAFKAEHRNYSESYGLNYLSKIDDPFYPALAALENAQEVNGETVYNPATILTESTIRSKVALENPSIRDAFVLARNESVNPSPERIAELSGATIDDVKRELIESGAAFEEPGGDLVPSDIYLSGNIRQKLRQAQAGLENGNEAMRRNIEALEAVMPEDIPYYKIETQLGATWIPTTVYEEFVAHMLGLSDASDIKATFIGGSWKIDFPSNLNHRTEAKTGFGTPRYDFKKLVNAAISNQSINIRVKHEDGSTSIDQEATNEVNARITEMRQRFAEWLWSDPNRQVDLEFEYNESRNPYATPKFDGSFLGFEGMSLTLGNGPFNLREHQVNAIWRALVTKKSLNAHEVGTGKTFTMGGIAVESRRYGIAKKPLLFAHNANSRSVANEIQMMYPAAKILYVDNLSTKNIKTRMMQIANDDWDVVVFPHSLIDRIGFKEETLMEMAQQQLDELEQAAKEAAIDDGIEISDGMLTDPDELKKLRSVTAKELVKQRLNILETIKKLSQQSSRENAISFEDLGVDMVLVDEAHEFKKPPISTKMKIKGLQNQTSNKSIAMSFITKYVRSMNNGGNVHLFTGTPITNTMTEIYHMQRYLMQEEMEEAGLSDWDGWFGSFARETEDVELTSTGEYEKITRLQSFINVPELRRMIGQYMDVVFSDDMPEMQPRVVDGKQLNDPDLTEAEQAKILNGRTEGARDRPYKRIVNESSDMSEEQNVVFSRVQQWANTWRNMTGKDRKEAMAKGSPEVPIIYDGVAERASFDVRLVNGIENAGKEGSEEMTPHPQSKPARVVKNLIDIYNSDERATQVVFMGQGMSDVVTRSEGEPGNKQQVRHKSFSTLKDMIERLVQQGIPRERIATVTGSTSKEKRAEVADMMNRGEIRIVFGSTQSLGVGVNMQRNLRAMHHMDAPWMPGDLEQRNGRGHRQGNQWNTVLEYRYLTDRIDGRRWQVLAIKQRFINDFMRSKGNERVIDGDAVGDEQGDILSTFSEAAGDPRILVREKLKNRIDGLKSRERMNNRAKADGQNQLNRLNAAVDRDNARLQELQSSGVIKKVSDLINNQLGDKFKATIFGQSFNSSTQARDFVRDKMASNIRLGEDKQIGTYGNVPLHAYWNQFKGEPSLYIDIGNETIESNGPSLPSLASALRDFRDNEESNLVKGIADKIATIERLENVIAEPFHMANELARAEKQLDSLETDLTLNPFAPPYWLRSGAPVDTNVMWQGKEFLVTGHRWNNDGYFVLAEDDSGAVAIPYLEAKDGQGMQVYEEQAFEAPKVVINDKESDKVDMSVISNPLAHIDADSINDRLRTGELGNVMGRLLDSGQVTIHATTDSLPDNVVSNGLAIQGYTERATGKIHLIAENLTVDSALPVVMHELVHANGKSLLGENRWNNLLARGQAYLNSAMIRKSEGNVDPNSFWDRALNRVETAKAEGLIQDGREAEEFLAYTLEEYQRAPNGIKKWASNLVGVVKDWLRRNFNIQLGSVTPGQLRALAINAAKQSRSRQPDIPNSDISYSVNGRRVLPTSTNIRTDDGQPLVRFFYPSEGIHVLIREDDWYSGVDELPTYNYKGEPTAGLQTINRSRLVTALKRPDDPFRDAEEAAEMEFYELPEIPESAYVNNNLNVPTADDIDAYFENLSDDDRAFAEREAAIEESNAAQSRAEEVKPNDIVKENGKPLNNKEKEQFLDDATEFLEREDLSEPQSMVRGDFIGQATKDMVGARSLYTKFMVHPYQVASLYPEFTPVFDVSTRQNQTRNKIIEDLHQDHVLYQQLSQKSKANVNKALELGRLTYQAWSKEEVKAGVNNRGFNYTVEMDDQGKPKRVRKDFSAQLSKSGDTIKLNDAEADAYVALRNMFDRALDMFRDQMLEEMGLGWLNTHEGEGRPLVLRELEDGRIVLKGTVYDAKTKNALDEAVSPVEIRNILANHPILSVVKNVTKGVYSKEHGGYVYPAAKRGQLESELDNFLGLSIEEQILSLKKEGMTPERLEFYDNVARAVGDIEQSKRTGYVPFTRYGDYVIAVKERIHDIKYRTSDTGEIYATDVPDSLNDFLDDIGAEYDSAIGGWLLSERQQDRLERENENTIYSEKVETGLRDMFGNNSERNVKMRKGKVTDIKSVKDAMERIERDYISGHENRRITSFETAKKQTSGEVDFTGIDVLAETAMIDTATWEAVRNQLIKAMGSKGFRSHFFQSSNVPGYSPDFERSIADYVVGLSGYLARRRHSAEWDNAVSNVQGEKLHKYATSYRNYSNEPSEEYALLRQTGFFMYIAGNISSAFLNATQVALMSMPMLSMVSNSVRATTEVTRAYKEAIAMVRANKTTGFDIFDFTKAPDDVKSSLIKASQEGLLLPLQALEIMGVAGRRSVKGRQAQRRYDTAVQTLALPFTFAERLNRIVTFIAAHRIASKEGYNANIRRIFRNNPQAQMMMAKEGYSPYSFAEFLVDETQFRMGKTNRPTAMRNVGAAIFQFKSFMLQFFEALYRNGTIHGKEGKKAVAATLAMMIALSGLWGLPGAEDLIDLFEGMYRHITKRDKDVRTDLRQFVFEATNSNYLAALVDGGFPYAGGVDMRGRIGMGQIMPETQSPTGIDWLDTAVSLGGIPADILVGRPVRALQASSSGEYGRATTELLPNFVENQRKSVEWQLDGVRTRDGRMVMPKEDVETSSKYMKFFGFQPSQVSDVYAANFAKTRAQSSADNLQRYYVDQYVRLLGAISRSQNPEQTAKLQGEASDLINEVYEQNEKLPPHQRININRSTINNAFRREQQGFGSGRGRGASAANSASIDEAFGINND